MFYHYVWVRSSRYHGSEPLTYSSKDRLAIGSIVMVELQKTLVIGFISGLSEKPKFQTKNIYNVLDIPPLPAQLIKLAAWVKEYYPAPIGIITQQLLPVGISDKQINKDSVLFLKPPKVDDLPPLTDEQSAAIKAMGALNTYLVHGKTGSGKTRLYIELAVKAVENNVSAIILTPEISLTSQLSNNFRKVFGDRVLVLHSKQTDTQRKESWLHALRSKDPLIIIGPRSALFAPLAKVGLIILDEAHESAYKQEQAPQYQTSRVAAYLASLSRARLILGTATPLVTDYFLAEQKKKPIIELNKLAQKNIHPSREIVVVDRKDHSLFSRSPYMSQPLIECIESALTTKRQSLLYLNRRGTARLVMCENCGWQATCPNCDVPLTYHGDKHEMRCHSCSYHSLTPSNCPDCGYASVVFKTAGTKAIVLEAQKLFPNARISRFDTDNLKADSFEQNYEAAHSGEIDILIGTQLLAKGLDLPKLSVVGILLADTSLYIPDFTAQERTFQLINQVLGRIGRGHVPGKAVIQTYHPDHPILKYAIDSNYKDFYESELSSRQEFMFPPYCYLLKLTARRSSLRSVELAAEKLKDSLLSSGYKIKVEGPAPSFYERLQGKFQWQLVIKSKSRSELIKVIDNLPANWSYDIDPVDLL
jgi:primosomal protein N' (replication factor Y)